jgi:hypothetical protein
MKIILLTLIFAAQISFSQEKIVADPIDDQINHNDEYDIEYIPSSLIVKIILDFNNDGIDDIAISVTRWGNAGGYWCIYLGRKDRKYTNIGNIFFHPLAFTIIPQNYGVSSMMIFHRWNAGEGDLIEYSISDQGIKEMKSRVMKPADDEDHAEYIKLFGDLYKHPKSTCCRLLDYVKDKNCKWYPGYYIRDK